MVHADVVEWGCAAVAAVVVAAVAAAAVFVAPTPLELALATSVGAVPLFAGLATVDADPGRLGRFVVVFCGSLVGLTLLVTASLGPSVLEAFLLGLAGLEFAVGWNPVMAVLVGGALALAAYAVFRWADPDADDGRSGGRATRDGRCPPGTARTDGGNRK